MKAQRRTNIFVTIDWLTVTLYLILILLGWINIYAAVYNEEHKSIFDITQRYGKQLIWIIAALLIAWGILLIDFNFYDYFAYLIYGFTIIVLLAVLLIGTEIHGARSWFSIRGFNIQPSEFSKIATALALAKIFSSYGFQFLRFRSIILVLAIIFLPAALILLQPDTGSSMVFAAFIFVLYREGLPKWILAICLILPALFIISLFYSTTTVIILLLILALGAFATNNPNIKYIFYSIAIISGTAILLFTIRYLFKLNITPTFIWLFTTLIAAGIVSVFSLIYKIKHVWFALFILFSTLFFTQSVDFVFHHVLKPHQQQRVNILLGIESDPLGIGYNVNQSKIAIGSGGLTGKGFLQGTQTKFNFVPEQTTDFIFCTVGEEWGFIGSFIVVILFTALLIRLIQLAERQRSLFGRIYGYGVISVLFFHIIINIGMTIGVFPVIGIPLPFFSYGGSSLWAFTILLFIFLNFDARRFEIMR